MYSQEVILYNGMYIPFVNIFLYILSGDFFLSTIISLKLFSLNYFYWFGDTFQFKNINKNFNFIKQFVRFTDSGHIVSLLYYFYPFLLPLAYNVHFVITFGYWSGKLIMNMKDADEIEDSKIVKWYEKSWCYSLHIVPYLLFVNELRTSNVCSEYFSMTDLFYSYLWISNWFIFIYTLEHLSSHNKVLKKYLRLGLFIPL